MDRLKRFWLLFHTIRYLSPDQVRHRLWRMVRIHWRKLNGTQAPHPSGYRLQHYQSIYTGLSDIGNRGPWQAQVLQSLEQAKEISRQHFSFLQHSHVFDKQVLWEDPNLSQLWRYHLHYFDYVNDLLVWSAVGHTEEAYQAFRGLADSWIQGNQRLTGDGWHPYTLSLRIVNWLNAFGFWRKRFDGDAEFKRFFLSSLYGQTKFLAANLEHDVRGNHLLKNIKALLWSGLAFSGREASRWHLKGMALLEIELAEQVLSDGGHFERTPGYHAMVLKDCLETGLWLRRNSCPVPAWLDETVLKMLGYLKTIAVPDGNLPLLKDTSWDAVPSPAELLAAGAIFLKRPEFKVADVLGDYALRLFGREGRKVFNEFEVSTGTRELKALNDTGFFVLRDDPKGDYLIFDAGKLCPEYLPAHAHADMLSYELMVAGHRVVVDSGVYEYQAGKWRDFFRATRAHNTVEIEGENQSEVWGSFRVARRASPSPARFKRSPSHAVVDVWHDGYRRLGFQVFHRRVLIWESECFWFVFDEIYGEGRVCAKSFIHLHPALEFTPRTPDFFDIKGIPKVSLTLKSFGGDQSHIIKGREHGEIQGWYSEEFGQLAPNSVLVLEKEGVLPFCFGNVFFQSGLLDFSFSQSGPRQYDVRLVLPKGPFLIRIEPEQVTYEA